MGLPLDYAIRNLGRRWLRTLLTAGSSALVAALLVATTAFVRGLEHTFGGAASAETALLLASSAERDVVRSAVDAGLGDLVEASVRGVDAASDEIHSGTKVFVDGVEHAGFVRGVTPRAYLVHEALTLIEGRLPESGEVLAGRLVASQLGVPEERLALGSTLEFEGAQFEVVGRFAAPGTTLEAELWTPLDPLRGLTQRSDSSVTFVRFSDPETLDRLDLFTRRRLDLELVLIPSEVYYAELTAYFTPIQNMAWALAAMIAAAALFGGANTINAAVQDRLRELATLRAVGYSGLSIVRSLAQESVLLSALGGVVGLALARVALSGGAVRLAMSAFSLRVDAVSILVGFGGALLLGLLGAAPAAVRLMRMPIALALKEE